MPAREHDNKRLAIGILREILRAKIAVFQLLGRNVKKPHIADFPLGNVNISVLIKVWSLNELTLPSHDSAPWMMAQIIRPTVPAIASAPKNSAGNAAEKSSPCVFDQR